MRPCAKCTIDVQFRDLKKARRHTHRAPCEACVIVQALKRQGIRGVSPRSHFRVLRNEVLAVSPYRKVYDYALDITGMVIVELFDAGEYKDLEAHLPTTVTLTFRQRVRPENAV